MSLSNFSKKTILFSVVIALLSTLLTAFNFDPEPLTGWDFILSSLRVFLLGPFVLYRLRDLLVDFSKQVKEQPDYKLKVSRGESIWQNNYCVIPR